MDLSDDYDVFRLLGVIGCGVLILATPVALMQRMPWHQKVRFAGIGLVGVALGEIFVTTLGHDPTTYWRIPVLSVGMALSALGIAVYLWKIIFPPR